MRGECTRAGTHTQALASARERLVQLRTHLPRIRVNVPRELPLHAPVGADDVRRRHPDRRIEPLDSPRGIVSNRERWSHRAHETLHTSARSFVDTHRHDTNTAVRVVLADLVQVREFLSTGLAPRRPDV